MLRSLMTDRRVDESIIKRHSTSISLRYLNDPL